MYINFSEIAPDMQTKVKKNKIIWSYYVIFVSYFKVFYHLV